MIQKLYQAVKENQTGGESLETKTKMLFLFCSEGANEGDGDAG